MIKTSNKIKEEIVEGFSYRVTTPSLGVILLINQLADFGEKQLSVFGSRLMHLALLPILDDSGDSWSV